MRFLVRLAIKLFGERIARQIEQGSQAGAAAGTLIGILTGVATAYVLLRLDRVGSDYSVALYLILAIPYAIVGAFVGARIGPRRRAVDNRNGVRISRYNKAGGTLAIALLFTGALAAIVLVPDGKKQPGDTGILTTIAIGIVVSLLTIGAWFIAVRDIWYVRLGESIRIRRLLGSRKYKHENLKLWGFEIEQNKVIQETFSGALNLLLVFDDRRGCRIEVDGALSRDIILLLGDKTVPVAGKVVEDLSPLPYSQG